MAARTSGRKAGRLADMADLRLGTGWRRADERAGGQPELTAFGRMPI